MTRSSRFRVVGAAAIAALAVAAGAGCGGSGAGADAAATGDERREEFRQAALDFARCMREEGIDMPDPQFDGGGVRMRLGGPAGVDPDQPGFEEAERKCREHLESVDPPELSAEQREEFRQAALDFARCMRGEGIDMPDPQFDGGRVRMRAGGPGDRDDPAMQAAFEKCRDELPEGRGSGAPPAP